MLVNNPGTDLAQVSLLVFLFSTIFFKTNMAPDDLGIRLGKALAPIYAVHCVAGQWSIEAPAQEDNY
jgi:hypothetical protein